MKAIFKDAQGVRLAELPRPVVKRDDEVLIRTALAGLCRTDCYVAEGLIRVREPVILGHEFSGTVVEVGAAVQGFAPGDRVAVMPVVPCTACRECRSGRPECCLKRAVLGVDRDGAFAQYVAVPARVVHALPAGLSFMLGAYAEPVAAALAVLRAGILPEQRGLIYGAGRIAELAGRVLRAFGFDTVLSYDPFAGAALPDPDSFDYVIETTAGAEPLTGMIAALRPGGKLVLKSRGWRPVSIDPLQVLNKEITIHAVYYGSFAQAVELMASCSLCVDDLLGEVRPLEEFAEVFDAARRGEQAKVFFSTD